MSSRVWRGRGYWKSQAGRWRARCEASDRDRLRILAAVYAGLPVSASEDEIVARMGQMDEEEKARQVLAANGIDENTTALLRTVLDQHQDMAEAIPKLCEEIAGLEYQMFLEETWGRGSGDGDE